MRLLTPASHWLRVITWPGYWLLIGWAPTTDPGLADITGNDIMATGLTGLTGLCCSLISRDFLLPPNALCQYCQYCEGAWNHEGATLTDNSRTKEIYKGESKASYSCLYPMRWQISYYVDQTEKRGCSGALLNSQLICFALSFIYLLEHVSNVMPKSWKIHLPSHPWTWHIWLIF